MSCTEDQVRALIAVCTEDGGTIHSAIKEQVRAIIAECIQEGNQIHTAIKDQIKESLYGDGQIQCAIQGQVCSATELVKEELDKDAVADTEFPFRKVLRSTSCAEYTAAGSSMMVDPDHIQSMSDGLNSDGSVGRTGPEYDDSKPT